MQGDGPNPVGGCRGRLRRRKSATREVVLAGKLLDIAVLDHLVVSDDPSKFTSLAIRSKHLFR